MSKLALILFVTLVTIVVLCEAKKSSLSKSSANKRGQQIPLEQQRGFEHPLLQTELKSVDASACPVYAQHERITHALASHGLGQHEQARSCLVRALVEDPSLAGAWTSLGHISENASGDSSPSPYFEEARKLKGACCTQVHRYDVIGPFPIGKNEVDGDPLEHYGGVRMAARDEARYPSDLVEGGFVSWTTVDADHENRAPISFPVDWNTLIRTTSSMETLEWQGWAVAQVFVNTPGRYKVRCMGVTSFWIDERGPFTGDIYNSGRLWTPISFTRGVHLIYIRLRAKVQLQISFNVQAIDDKAVMVFAPSHVPDIVDGDFVGDALLALPVTNLMETSVVIRDIQVDVASNAPFSVSMHEQQPPRDAIATGQLVSVHARLAVESRSSRPQQECQFTARVTVHVQGLDKGIGINIQLRCRRGSNQSFLFTYIDHDNAVTVAAAVPPMFGKKCRSISACAVLLSLHGTGVSANDQADAYKQEVRKDDWLFGVAGAWVVAPDRFGAHNWEQTGFYSALSAVRALTAAVQKHASFAEVLADDSRVLYAGHSMGGHGAWHLATHAPDGGLGVAVVAGWIKKESYGDSNTFMMHDVGVSYTDPILKGILEATIAENYNDLLAPNIKGMPALARVGAADATVPPWQQRRMVRVLRAADVDVNYTEIAGKEHWWWDTKTSSDGGCVNDKEMRKFFKTAINRDVSLPRRFEQVIVNPASSYGRGGLRVLQQIVPFKVSRVTVVRQEGDKWDIATSNVLRMSIRPLPLASSAGPVGGATIDGCTISEQDIATALSDTGTLVRRKDGDGIVTWSANTDALSFEETQRGPANYGPARQVAESPFSIVVGSGGVGSDAATNATTLMDAGLFISNHHFAAYNTPAVVVTEDAVDELPFVSNGLHHNLILIGSPNQNKVTKMLHANKPFPLKIDGSTVHLGSCKFSGPGIGVVFVTPLPLSRSESKRQPNATNWRHGRLALVIAGTDTFGLQQAVRLADPTIPPMVRAPYANIIPDYIVVGPGYASKGVGGILASGFWGNDWEFDPRSSYTVDDC